jgi:ketosteroid isomerase-like protein
MKCRAILCALIALPLFLCSHIDLYASDTAKDEKAVLSIDRERTEAQIKQDSATLDRLLSDDLTYVHASGLVQSKAEFIADLQSNKRVYKSITNSDVNVRLLQGTAIITSKSEIKVSFDGKENDLSLQVIEVYAKRNERWQLIAYQSTRLKP